MNNVYSRLLSLLLVAILLVSYIFPCAVCVDAENWTDDESRNTFIKILKDLEVYQSDKSIFYWKMVNNIGKDKFLSYMLDIGANFIGENPTKEDYGTILSYILTMQEINTAANISSQISYDNFRNAGDAALDIIGIAMGILGSIETTSVVSPVADAFDFGKNTFSSANDSITYYSIAISEYANAELLLDTIIKHSNDDELRETACTLLNDNVALLSKKLDLIAGHSGSAAENLANFYINNIFFKAIQSFNDADMESIRWLGKTAEKFISTWSMSGIAFDITMLAGNTLFGTNDQYKTYHEMVVLAEIAQTLSAEIQETKINGWENSESSLDKLFCLYKMLLTTHSRGEYLIFHMLDNHGDANRAVIKFFTGKELITGDEIDELRKKQLQRISHSYSALDNSYNQPAYMSVSVKKNDSLYATNEQLGDVSPNSFRWEHPDEVKKLPSSIILYADGSKSEEYFFSYNSSHQVIGLECYRYENKEAIKWFSQKYEYDENGNPTLIEHSFSQGTQKYQYVYDYNSSGQITGYSYAEYYKDALGPTDYYTFSYDGARVSERHNKDGSSIEKFSYDESKNIVYETAELEHGDGHFDESTTFDFTYAPFVIYTHTSESKEYGNSSGKFIVFMPHWNLSPASCDIDDSCSLYVNASGDLVRVTDANGDNICIITYQESTSSPIGLYLPKVQRAREQSMSAEDVDEKNVNAQTYGILMDWDDDGLQELFISYVQPERWYGIRKIGVYDIQGGQLITLIEDLDTTFAEAAAGMHDFAGVTMYKGTPAVFAWSLGENTSKSPREVYYGARTYFTLWDINSQSVLHKAEIVCDGNNLSYVIDSVACTEADFYSLIGDCTFLSYDSAPPTAHLNYTIETLKVDDLIDILQKGSPASGANESTYGLSDASEGDDNLKAEVQTQPHFPESEDTSTEAEIETTPSNYEFQNEPTTPVQSISGCIANADSGLNVRQEPSTSAKIIRRVYNGEWVTITEQTTIDGMPWGRISDGWICMNYVKTEDASSKSQEHGKQYIVAPSAGSLNVRCGPGTSYQSVERIDGGEKVLIYEEKSVDGRNWGRTGIGWVCMDYLISSP